MGIEIDKLLSSYDYELPEELIAQAPAVPRDSARLLVANSSSDRTNETDGFIHSRFRNLPDFLRPGDLLVLNNTRVMPARLYGKKSTGAPVEVLLLEERQHNCWLALVKPGKRLQPGATIFFEGSEEDSDAANTLTASVLARDEATNGRVLQFDLPAGVTLPQVLDRYGQLPLPPYISSDEWQPEQYQTVYASSLGAVAAPTAGLHFTEELLQQLQQQGIQQAFITLHVGIGTFRPVEVENITDHKMHGEWVEVSAATVEQIRQTKANGGRVIAVGTTVTRSLEAAASEGLQPYQGKTDLFIYPGYEWRVVDGLITNFHLPRSSLLMLVSALIGRERLLALYQEAIAQRYRFYSFGDAMLLLPQRD